MRAEDYYVRMFAIVEGVTIEVMTKKFERAKKLGVITQAMCDIELPDADCDTSLMRSIMDPDKAKAEIETEAQRRYQNN